MTVSGQDPVPSLWILAGGDGSRKSTFYRMFLHEYRFVNADLIAQTMYAEHAERRSYDAALCYSSITVVPIFGREMSRWFRLPGLLNNSLSRT